MYRFSKTSQRRLDTCHTDLQIIMEIALANSNMDFGISEGYRSPKRQMELYASGRTRPGPILTNVDGVKTIGKHNSAPSLAVDIFAWTNGGVSWEEKDLCYLAGIITAVANMLLDQDRISHKLRWGGNWDGDGTIINDQKFKDLPHFELIEA